MREQADHPVGIPGAKESVAVAVAVFPGNTEAWGKTVSHLLRQGQIRNPKTGRDVGEGLRMELLDEAVAKLLDEAVAG